MVKAINPKIEWYQEVLGLEPSSRVFFALAKLLSQAGDEQEAIEVLKKGLVYHPEYIEAKLFLFELLNNHSSNSEQSTNLQELSQVFTSYPTFWTAWGEQEINNADLSCTLGILGLLLKQDQISIQKILLAGIKTLNKQESKTEINSEIVSDKTMLETVIEPITTIEAAIEELITTKELVEPEPVDEFVNLEVDSVEELKSKNSGDLEESSELKCSTYTRSMAELLAEQGDISGALNILEKLLASHNANDDLLGISDIKKRIETLNAYRQSNQNVAKDEKKITSLNEELTVKETQKDKTKQNKTVTFLSNLASRLEARSQSANI